MMDRKCLIFSFAGIEVRECEFRIVRGGEVRTVEPKAFRVLLFLLRNPKKVITKDELLDAVWNDVAVSENSLTRAITLLRKLLDEDTHEPRFIATVPRVGYRFLCDVTISEDGFIESVDARKSAPAAETDLPQKSEEKLYPDHRWRLTSPLLIALCALAIITPVTIFLILRAIGRHKAPSEARVAEQRVTSNSPEAPVDSAVVSPDGKFAAYADPTGLYLRVIASGETRRWALPKGFVAEPNSWFPDGTHLLVMRWEGRPPTPSLWKISLLGGSPQKLIDGAVSGSVSPDGTRIAFGTFLPSWGRELWVMGGNGSNPHKIAEASQRADPSYPSGILSSAWSPDGRRIACIERYGFAGLSPATDLSTLWTRDEEGGDLQVIFKNTLLGPALSWTPDGRILFGAQSNLASERDDEDLSSIRVDEHTGKASGQQQVVTHGSGAIGGISVTSDGKRLMLWRTNSREQAFISEFDAHTRKWKNPRRLTLDANGNQATAWLPDSRTVLFVSNRNGTWTLFKQAIDETTAEVLVEGRGLYLPRLSADGSQVLYGSQPDPTNPSAPVSLMRLPVAGGPPRLVARDVGLGNYQCAHAPSTLCIIHKSQQGDCVFLSFDPSAGLDANF